MLLVSSSLAIIEPLTLLLFFTDIIPLLGFLMMSSKQSLCTNRCPWLWLMKSPSLPCLEEFSLHRLFGALSLHLQELWGSPWAKWNTLPRANPQSPSPTPPSNTEKNSHAAGPSGRVAVPLPVAPPTHCWRLGWSCSSCPGPQPIG